MQESIVGGEAPARNDRGAVARLLGWWRLAGVDTPVSNAPQRWFTAETLAAAGLAEAPDRDQVVEHDIGLRFRAADLPGDIDIHRLRGLAAAKAPGAPFADGNPDSRVMLLGEGPSAEDLRTGRPFTGPAGVLLDRMLAAIGRDRTSAYISLIAPFRPVPGAVPVEDIEAQLPLTKAHVRLARPKALLLLGSAATRALTGETGAIHRARGKWLTVDLGDGPIPALPTFNPAYLLRRPQDKKLAWADLLAFREQIR
jgi:DNA polymerase